MIVEIEWGSCAEELTFRTGGEGGGPNYSGSRTVYIYYN